MDITIIVKKADGTETQSTFHTLADAHAHLDTFTEEESSAK